MNEIRMKQYPVCRRTDIRLHLCFRHLTGSEADDGSFLVIVRLAAVRDVSASGIFQKEGIYSVIDLEVRGPSGSFRQVDDCHHRVQGLESEQFVVFVNMIQFDYFYHRYIPFVYHKCNVKDAHNVPLGRKNEDWGTNIRKSGQTSSVGRKGPLKIRYSGKNI